MKGCAAKLITVKKRLSKTKIFWITFAVFICAVMLICLAMQIALLCADRIKCWHPDYERVDLSGILNKSELTDGDYELIFNQTGLTQIGTDRILARGEDGKRRLLKIQDDYFAEHKVKGEIYAPLICSDKIDASVTSVYLEDGDIIITSSTHFSGWRIGHAGLVTSGARGEVLQASSYGTESGTGNIRDFTGRVNFLVLSPKADDELKSEVVQFALSNLKGKRYSVTAGLFSDKNKINATQCAHLVWFAYKKYGIDLDGNGGKLVTPRDVANSPEVELVQTFGFNPNKLWT